MATITYSFLPGDTVWHITDDCGIKEAVVKVVRPFVIEVDGSPSHETTLRYDIQYVEDIGTTTVEGEDRLFALLSDALTAYQTILEE